MTPMPRSFPHPYLPPPGGKDVQEPILPLSAPLGQDSSGEIEGKEYKLASSAL
jgi:hypothetical protein